MESEISCFKKNLKQKKFEKEFGRDSPLLRYLHEYARAGTLLSLPFVL